MKKSCIIKIIMLAILLLFAVPICTSMAATDDSDVLITSSGVTITKTTTIQQITSKYGAGPKLATPSAFGGNMYTWYKGDYEDVIYAETDSKGIIIACGAISDDFKSSFYSAGDRVPSSGTVYPYQGTVSSQVITRYANGIVIYQKDLLTSERVNTYKREYVSKKYYYDKSLAQQSVIMLNALLRKKGSPTRAQFNSDLYDKAKKIKDTMNMSAYAEKNGKEQYYREARTDYGYLTLYQELPNPLRPAASSDGFFPTEELKYVYLGYSIFQNEETGKYVGGLDSFYMSEKLFEKTTQVKMTSEEETKYNNAKEIYINSIETYNQNGKEIYETQPEYLSLPLVAGKIKTNKLVGATDYLNAIRVAAGIGKLTHNSDLSNSAQHKAVLTSYITSKGISNSNPHYPTKPTGVSDEFYSTAQKYMSGENLYGGDIINAIAKALHDGQGDPIKGGHRYNLLNPNWTYFGEGYSNGQAVHKLSGYKSSNVNAIAWPSIGITPMEAWYNNCYWTFKIYGSKYSIQSNTTVEVKRLNDNKIWTFDDMSATNTNNASRFVRGSGILSFYNEDLTGKDGLIYEITIKNIKNNEKNVVEDYTYRTVFKYLSGGINVIYPTQVTLDKTSIKGTKGSEQKLNVTFSSSETTEVSTKWYSSNTKVATVNQFGIVKFVAPGSAIIRVETLNGKKSYCTVQCVSTIAGLKFENSNIILKQKESEQLKLIETSGIILDTSKVKWTISDSSKATIDSTGTVIANKEGDIKVVASYEGKSATCTVKILPRTNYSPTFKLVSGLEFYDKLAAGETTTVTITQAQKDYSIYLNKIEGDFTYNADNLEIVSIKPVLKGITGKITESGKIHFSYDSGTEINKIAGDIAIITVKAKNTAVYGRNYFDFNNIKYRYYGETRDTSGICQYIASVTTANNIKSISISKTSCNLSLVGSTTRLTATITPSENVKNTTITWTTSNSKVATVDNRGLVQAKGEGTAIITATTSNGKKATCTITVPTQKPATIAITKIAVSPTTVTINKGSSNIIKATITPSNTTQSKTVTWTSSNNAIATVDNTGKVTARGEGTAIITATTSNGKKATCKVTVPKQITKPTKPTIIEITGVKVSPTTVTINKGSSNIIKATITPSNTTQSKTVTWTSSNNAIATVDNTGKVTAKGEGTATITAKTSNGKTATCKVTVPKQITKPIKPTVIEITGVKVSPTTVTINKGSSNIIKATITPSNTTQSKTVTWTSSNNAIATVDNTGKVTARGEGTATITAKTSNGKTATCKVTVPKQTTTPTTPTTPSKKTPSVSYRTHVQNIGWQNYVKDGAMSGTSGKSLRLEGINIALQNNEYGGGISYQTHVQNIGWQNYVQNGAMSGTTGRSLRLEGIRIKLTGEIANYYDVYYRVHCQNFGWMDWAKNGESAGSAGYSYRLEGIEVRLVKKGEKAPGKTEKPFIQKYITYQTHVQNIGWQSNVRDNEISGTSGKSLRLEGIKIALENQQYNGNIEYRTHVQNIGWQNYVKNGAMSGTSGRSLRLEAIQIRLTGTMAQKYDIYYRVHCQNFGWMGWAKNDQPAGSQGYSYRLEAIQICIVKKGAKAPGSTVNCFVSK